MPDFKKPYLASIVILLFLIRLGASQHFDGGDTSSTTNDPNTDQKPFNILKKLLEKKRSSSTQGSPKHNITSGVELDDIVTTRFRKEMAMLFSWLPESNQCNIFVTVSKKTQCSVPNIIELLFSLTEMKHNVNVSCPVANTIKVKTCSQGNRTFVGDIFCDELLKVFASLPSSFKCHIINTIALAYNPKGRRHLANKYSSLQLSVSQAQTAVASIFPTVSLPLTCANMEMNHLIPSTPPVNITVNLTSADKETWLKALMKKGPEVFKTFLEYEKMIKDKGQVLSPASTEKYLADNEELINSTQLFTVGIDGGSKIFSVLFRLKVKWKQSNRLREMKSTYKIVQALSAKNHKELRTIFNANIISISLSGERSNITKTPPKSNKWSLQQISDGKDLFPAYLSQYYKQLGKPARCFVVYFISLKIKKSQLEVEMFYVSFDLFSRKHACIYTRRNVPTDTPIQVFNVTHERNTHVDVTLSTQATTEKRTGIPLNGSKNAIDSVSDQSKEDLSTLEIALFSLLGLLCISVLAFTVNCVVMALKAKSAYQSNTVPKTALQTAEFHKGTNVAGYNRNDCVHFPVRNNCHFQPADTQHLPTTESIIWKKRSCNCAQPVSTSMSHEINTGRCDNKRTCLKSSQHVLDSSRETRTNSRTKLENEYCLDSSPIAGTFKSSQLCNKDSAVKDSPDAERSSSKIERRCPRRELDDHSVQDSPDAKISSPKIEHRCPRRELDDHSVQDSPDAKRSSSKIERRCPRRELDDHNLQDSPNVERSSSKIECQFPRIEVNDHSVQDSPNAKRSSPKIERRCPRRELDDHSQDSPNVEISSSSPRKELDDNSLQDKYSILESQGKATSYSSISETSYKAQPFKMMHAGCLPSEESHETVVVMLDCKGLKEEQV